MAGSKVLLVFFSLQFSIEHWLTYLFTIYLHIIETSWYFLSQISFSGRKQLCQGKPSLKKYRNFMK